MYYEVLVATQAYHGNEALTYSSDAALVQGAVVKVGLRSRQVLGIVLREVGKPDFAVKPIDGVAPYPAIPAENMRLLEWLGVYYPAPLGAVVRQFVPPSDVIPKERPALADTELAGELAAPKAGNHTPDIDAPPLTPHQKGALETITGAGTFLLHGITGSGKSRVYVELAARALKANKSALVLTPEIGLTAQLSKTFQVAFGERRVFILHSQQTAAERRTIWYGLLAAEEPVVVIGPRSALFAPVKNIGVIVLDEAHDNAYKNESAPHYHAARVAAKLASLHGASLVLGSATPDVEDYYLAQVKQRPIIVMDKLAKGDTRSSEVSNSGVEPADISTLGARDSTHIEMVDMRDTNAFSRSPLISNKLLEHVSAAMARGEQSLLFLNRRGTANVVLCSQCGWQSLCPNCDLSLTYHGDSHELRCHVCGLTSGLPSSCPVCGNTEILFKSIGTKAIVSAIQKLLPSARVQRFDTDAKKSERLEQHLPNIVAGGADIIVGTQIVGKGLDLPKLSVVGIINADSSLLIPDYTAAEKTYQLISQVVGRVGRGHRAGTVVVQSYNPENPTLQAALHGQWQTFYDSELTERKNYHYPPFTYLLKLRVLRATSASASSNAQKFAATLAKQFPHVIIEGPAPSFHPRERGKYSWQLLLKSGSRADLVAIIRQLPSGWNYDIDPINLL